VKNINKLSKALIKIINLNETLSPDSEINLKAFLQNILDAEFTQKLLLAIRPTNM